MSDYLFSNPSFLSGAARTLDLWALLDDYNYSKDEVEADARAMFLDWRATGEDIMRAWVALVEQEESREPAER